MDPLCPIYAHKLQYRVGDALTKAKGFLIATHCADLTVSFYDGLRDESYVFGGSNLRKDQQFGNHLLYEVQAGIHDGCAVWVGTNNVVCLVV